MPTIKMPTININGKDYKVKTKKGLPFGPWKNDTGKSYYTDDEGNDHLVKLENGKYVYDKPAQWKSLVATPKETQKMAEKSVESNKNVQVQPKEEKTEKLSPVEEVVKTEEKETVKTPEKTVTEEPKEEPETEEVKEPETPKEEEQKAEEKTPEQVAKEDTEAVQENKKATSDLLGRKEKFSNYLNSAHPSLFGAIFGDSGLTAGERIAMGASAMGKIIGSVLMANGMSLLGDNSYFSKIGEGVDLNSMTSDEQKKFADEMNNAMIETAKKAKRAEEVFDSNIKASNVNLTEDQRDFALTNINTYATMSDENAQKDLIAKGFTPEAAKATVQALKRTVKENPELLKAKSEVRTEKQEEYNFAVKQFTDKNELMARRNQLMTELSQISINNKKQLIELASNIAGFYGTASEAKNQNKNFGWSANADASIKFIASISGGVQGASSNGESLSTSGFTEEGKEKALQSVEKMSNEEIDSFVSQLKESYQTAINMIDTQLAKLENEVNDAVIPNGEIESVNLKDGTTLDVNENDGAVITTNPLPEGLLSFAEGEVNPFDYLGYDGDKKECEYYDTIFDEKEKKIESFEDALALLD